MSETVNHPIFARVYHWMSAKAEERLRTRYEMFLIA